MPFEEADRSKLQASSVEYYAKQLRRSAEFRQEYQTRPVIVKAADMPWESCPQGQIKHVIHEEMETKECALDLYQQFLSPGGASGKHRHLAEELFYVLEGSGYDLHWDIVFGPQRERMEWDWQKEPRRFEWEEGDFVYIPPYTIHQHFNASNEKPARFLSATNRLIKAMGFDWIDQVEPAPEYNSET